MASISEQIAKICDLGQLNTELIVMNRPRSSQDIEQRTNICSRRSPRAAPKYWGQ
jgi:hypothetical protein